MLRTKINVNLGISRDCKDYDVEMEKVMAAVDMGAHAIMDLSSHGNTIPFRRKLTAECPAMIGTVPVYDSVNSLSEGSCDTDLQRILLMWYAACRGWRGFCDAALRNHAQDDRADQEAQEKNEYCIQRRFTGVCVDVYDRRGESVLRVLR